MNKPKKKTVKLNLDEHRRLKSLFKKHKGLLRSKYSVVDFVEPVLLLMRRNNSVDFIENVKQGVYTLKHSDGDDCDILIDPAQLQKFNYGSRQFRGYIHHEDEALSYPHKPLLYARNVQMAIEKTLNDIKEWKAKEYTARGEMFWKIAIGIAVLILAYGIYKLLVPQKDGTEQAVVETVKNSSKGFLPFT